LAGELPHFGVIALTASSWRRKTQRRRPCGGPGGAAAPGSL
jgi:hypothetical protein